MASIAASINYDYHMEDFGFLSRPNKMPKKTKELIFFFFFKKATTNGFKRTKLVTKYCPRSEGRKQGEEKKEETRRTYEFLCCVSTMFLFASLFSSFVNVAKDGRKMDFVDGFTRGLVLVRQKETRGTCCWML